MVAGQIGYQRTDALSKAASAPKGERRLSFNGIVEAYGKGTEVWPLFLERATQDPVLGQTLQMMAAGVTSLNALTFIALSLADEREDLLRSRSCRRDYQKGR